MALQQFIAICAASAALALASPATAKIIDESDHGFTSAHSARVAASPDEVWTMLRMPQKWWSKAHSWSGDAENFWLDSQAGGCFCEKLPDSGGGMGSVKHAEILFAKPGALLRLSGALGPLQGEALKGTLTIQIKPDEDGGSRIRFDYVVGGYMRFDPQEIRPAVDSVIGEQLRGLANALGGALPRSAAEEDGGEGEGQAPAETDKERAASSLDSVAADLRGNKDE